jgi:hydroxyacylglutathione hydrolase
MSRLEIELIPVLSDNYCYLVHEPEAGVTAVVDPPVADAIQERLKAHGRRLDWILTTHHHADHTGGNLELKRATGCKVAGPAADAGRIPGIDTRLSEGDDLPVGKALARVLETPGHARGHISYWFPDSKALFCGDVLFVMGCGRLFEGSPAEMWRSISKFADMPDDTVVYCGHEYTLANARFALTVDPDNEALRRRVEEVERLRAEGRPTVPTTLGIERATNPFLRPHDPGIRRHLGMERASDVEVFAEIRARKDRA